MSDVRLRIGELFSENGILLAFPQRDVHLDITHPVQVELASGVNQSGGVT
jgi:small-conductance mechanosensitive channel